MNLNTIAAQELLTLIRRLDENITQLRLETIPDVERIRQLQENLDGARRELKELQEDIPVYLPV